MVDTETVLHRHGISIHPGRRIIKINGKSVDLTYTEFQIIHYLAGRPGWVFTRTQIVDAVRGDNYSVTDRSVDVQMVGLRKKLGPYGKYLETVRGVGYRFRE
jgi:two-component system phosphate regulon response regulator PhoB